MITSREAYKRFLLKINKNDTNEGISILPATFVLLFNSESPLWLGAQLKDKSDNSLLNQLQELLITDLEIEKLEQINDYVEFKIPENHYKYVSSYSFVNKEFCKEIKYYHYDRNSLNKNVVIQDEFTGPNFDFEEGPIILSDKKLKVFFKDFEINKSFITYYRKPGKIDIEGYINLDGSPSSNIDPDISDENVESILNRMAIEINRQEKDSEGFQYAQERNSKQP